MRTLILGFLTGFLCSFAGYDVYIAGQIEWRNVVVVITAIVLVSILDRGQESKS